MIDERNINAANAYETFTSMSAGEVAAFLQRFTNDSHWMSDQWEELKARFPDCYVAVLNQRVVAVATNVDEIHNQLDAKGIWPGLAVKGFLRSEPITLIL